MNKKINLKGVLSIILAMVIAINIAPTLVFAVSNEEPYITSLGTPQLYNADKADVETLEASVDLTELKEYLFEQFKTCSDRIDVSEYEIPNNEATRTALAVFIWEEIPEAFHVNELATSGGTYITGIHPTYLYTSDEYLNMYQECQVIVNQILQGIKNNNNLSDVEKALLIHDRLAVHCEYDYNNGENQFDIYGALVDKTAVCQGYAEAYDYLLEQVGIESYICTSTELYHAWNIIYINDEPYHVDVTWDDYSWQTGERGAVGVVVHDNFLRSSAGIYSTGHEADDYDTSPCDTTYDNYFWQNSETAFQLIGDEIYYIDNTAATLNRYRDTAELCSVEDIWKWQEVYHWGNNARLSSDGEELLYSLSDKVYKYNVETAVSEEIYAPILTDGTYIFGFAYVDGYLICDVNDCPPYASYGIEGLYQLQTLYKTTSAEDTAIGDVNSDGEVNNLDRQILTRHLAKWEGYEADKLNLKAADVNEDGEVNNLDRQILTRHLAKWAGYETLPYEANTDSNTNNPDNGNTHEEDPPAKDVELEPLF